MKALLVTAVFVVMALAEVASGTERGDRNVVGGPGRIGPAEPAGTIGATDRKGVSEEIRAGRGGGASAPAGAQGEDDFEGEFAADGDDGAIAAGPYIRRKGPGAGDGAPSDQADSAHARAPPALSSATRTGLGA